MNAAEEAELLALYRRAKEVNPEGARRVLMIAGALADGDARPGTAIGAVIDHVLGVAPVAWVPTPHGFSAWLGAGRDALHLELTAVGDEWNARVAGHTTREAMLEDAKANAINRAIVEAYQSANLTPIEGVTS